MNALSFQAAPDAIRHAIEAGTLKAGGWGDGTHAVCMMSAIVNGAHGANDCVTAGWPEWLVLLNVYLFDAKVGAEDECKARAKFALDAALAVSQPFDADKARDLFLIRCLETDDHSALASLRRMPVAADWRGGAEAAVIRVVDLLKRRINGEGVADEMGSARAAAEVWRKAAWGAARVAAEAGRVTAYIDAIAAAHAALRSAVNAAAGAFRADACVAVRAWSYADYLSREAAAHAASADTRADLIASIIEAQE